MRTRAFVRSLVTLVVLAPAAAWAQPGPTAPTKGDAIPDLPSPDAPATAAAPAPSEAPAPASSEAPAPPVTSAPEPASAAAPSIASAATTERAEALPSRARDWREIVGRLELGYRGVFVTNPGYNPFSAQDYFSGVSLAVSRTLASDGGFSFALGVAWDYGSSQATSRRDQAALQVHRLSVPIEGRVHAGAFGYAFVRLAPGVASEHVDVSDGSAPSDLTATRWLFAADASAGYALPIVPIPPRRGPRFRMWLQGEGGYSWVAEQRLALASTVPSGTTPMANQIDLGSLGLRGAFFRVAVAASY